jgi:hypothetical protein
VRGRYVLQACDSAAKAAYVIISFGCKQGSGNEKGAHNWEAEARSLTVAKTEFDEL